jgi:hypothetical protein
MSSTIGNQVPSGSDSVQQQLADLRRRVQQLASQRSLGSSSFSEGGFIVNPDGTSIAVRVDENVPIDGYSGTYTLGQIAFGSATAGAGEAQLHMVDQGFGSFLEMRTNPGSDGVSVGKLVLDGNGGFTFDHSDGTNDAGLQFSKQPSSGYRFSAYAGANGFSFTAGVGLTIFTNSGRCGVTTSGLACGALTLDSSSGTEWRAQATSSGGYVPVRASSFPTSSSKDAKQNVGDIPFDALAAVMAAPARQWQYKPGHAQDNTTKHISPMAEDLPAAVVSTDGIDKAVDLRDLVGVLWQAVTQLAARPVSSAGTATTPATLALNASTTVTVTLLNPMPADAYKTTVIPPQGYTVTKTVTTKTSVAVTLKAGVLITAAGTLTVMAST